MPSYTSSSDDRLPESAPVAVWQLGALVFFVILGAIEVTARILGYPPLAEDSTGVWCLARDRATELNEDGYVLLGDSKMLLGLVPEVLTEYTAASELVVLAADGLQPMAAFEHLSRDETFAGGVVCSLTMLSLLPEQWDDQEALVAYYENEWSMRRAVMARSRELLENNMSFIHPGLSFASLKRWIDGNPFLNYLDRLPNRHRRADFSRFGGLLDEAFSRAIVDTRDRFESMEIPSPEEMNVHYARLEQSVERFRDRGCQVVFLRFPTTKAGWAIDEAFWPRRDYWDKFANFTQAQTFHVQDFPGLTDIVCPDGTHMAHEDAVRFTEVFAKWMEGGLSGAS